MYKFIKRTLDILFSLLLFLLAIPLFLFVPFLIVFSIGFPVIFSQKRVGFDNQSFRIFKFRTMRRKNDILINDEQRITGIGSILRLFRIDELPQLYNILRGDMSFIGPRPLMPEYLPYYTSDEIRRHKVRPGLSGYSQISSLNYPKWEEQFKFDLYYVDNISFKLDFFIFMKTISRIIKPSGMMETGISGGRLNFDTYRKLELNNKIKFMDN